MTTASVAVKVGLKTKRLSGRRFRLEGATWPAVPSGRVSLQRQSRSGRWSPVARTVTVPAPRRPLALSLHGPRRAARVNYRVVVVARDGGAHVSGTSRTDHAAAAARARARVLDRVQLAVERRA